MAHNQTKTIYPCPFSKGYGIPVEQAWSLLKVFFVYKFIVSSLFAILFYSRIGPSLLGSHDPVLYQYTSLIFWLFSLLPGITIYFRTFSYTSQSQIILFTDIIFITLLMHASGGISSGIGMLLAVSIAAGGLLIGGRCALLFAALASLSILSEQVYAVQKHSFSTTSFTYAGMLGAAFFTIAYLSYVLAKRTEYSEMQASLHQQTISNLEELNQYIIQHLQSGIIISTSQQQIKMCNEAALNISTHFTTDSQPNYLNEISTQLSTNFQSWLADETKDSTLIHLPNKNQIHVRFSLLETNLETFHMIILEDISLYNQRLQKNKLASLGRLTASIAHEIRNPLGAISHAGQLLSEAPELSTQDQRLTEIIQSHCQRVNKIIEDVLQLSRRQSSKKEKINLNHWVQNYLYNFIEETSCGLDSFSIISKEANIFILMDPGHLKQIFDNLCTNALKYGDSEPKKITIEISYSDSSPRIKILNKGTEIEAEIVKHLFEPFFTTSPTGTGLGLYISKELAELNQATLSYAKEQHQTCFTLCLADANDSIIEI